MTPTIFNVFPNPTQDVLKFEFPHKENTSTCTTISIFDELGRLILETKCYTDTLIELSVSDFESGLYFANLTNSAGELIGVRKFVKQ